MTGLGNSKVGGLLWDSWKRRICSAQALPYFSLSSRAAAKEGKRFQICNYGYDMALCASDGCNELALTQLWEDLGIASRTFTDKFGFVDPDLKPICHACFKCRWNGMDSSELVDDPDVGRKGSGGAGLEPLIDLFHVEMVKMKESSRPACMQLLLQTAARGCHTVYSECGPKLGGLLPLTP